ncbi:MULTISPECIES: glycosyltransferase family 9 protein [unclassified Helicobacter]|uniref:glycosyltransferase family 9 protein n=1 Tax=unclassified Helicobacter TaxID=2593540 RepID=UPI000CF1044E|nr:MULTISPECIES: glycosyltransferase family 9 protein [unclassified Helicobacter]
MKIGYYICGKVGDSVVAISSLYAIKKYFPECELYVFTNTTGKFFYQTFSWIDFIILVDQLPHIPDCHLDFFISTDSTKDTKIKLQKTIKCKILTFSKLHNLFDFQFKTTFSFTTSSIEKRLLKLPKLIPHQRHNDFNLSQTPKINPPLSYQKKIRLFLDQNNPNHLKTILVNPFGFSQNDNLPLQTYAKIIENLIQDTFVIIPTFADKRDLIQSHFPDNLLTHPNFCIFHNNEDLLNITELIRQIDLLFSIDTGLIHIANNLQIKTIGLFLHRKTARKWGSRCTKCIYINQLKIQKVAKICTQEIYNLL